MSGVAYAVHTRTCSYLLDDDGVCRWIVSPSGMVPEDVRRCVGAQFVACLDPSISGGLVGELVLGAAALFVKHDDAAGRMILLRTSRIEHVEFRAGEDGYQTAYAPPEEPAKTEPPPMMYERYALDEDSFVDPEEIVQYDEESTVTLTMPLFRPEAQPRGRVKEGRTLVSAGSEGAPPRAGGPVPRSISSMATLVQNPVRAAQAQVAGLDFGDSENAPTHRAPTTAPPPPGVPSPPARVPISQAVTARGDDFASEPTARAPHAGLEVGAKLPGPVPPRTQRPGGPATGRRTAPPPPPRRRSRPPSDGD